MVISSSKEALSYLNHSPSKVGSCFFPRHHAFSCLSFAVFTMHGINIHILFWCLFKKKKKKILLALGMLDEKKSGDEYFDYVGWRNWDLHTCG